MRYNEKKKKAPITLEPDYKNDYLSLSPRWGYVEASFPFPLFFSCSFSFFFLFNWATSIVSSISTSTTLAVIGQEYIDPSWYINWLISQVY